LELSVTEDTDNSQQITGWTEITSLDATNNALIIGISVDAKVTGGTLELGPRKDIGLGFNWRVD